MGLIQTRFLRLMLPMTRFNSSSCCKCCCVLTRQTAHNLCPKSPLFFWDCRPPRFGPRSGRPRLCDMRIDYQHWNFEIGNYHRIIAQKVESGNKRQGDSNRRFHSYHPFSQFVCQRTIGTIFTRNPSKKILVLEWLVFEHPWIRHKRWHPMTKLINGGLITVNIATYLFYCKLSKSSVFHQESIAQ